MTVFLLLVGEGCDGDEQSVEGVYATRELAEQAKTKSGYPDYRSEVEEWHVQEIVK